MKDKRKQMVSVVLLLLLSCLPLFDLLHPGMPLTHDGQDHVARIANFYQNLQEGNIIPRWAENLNWGYGHPILMFLYPLPSYLASLFHVFGFSFVDSTKLVFAVSFVFSILCMYLWLRTMLADKAAFVGAILYGFAPYHFVDLYVRGAIGEMVALIFPPLVLLFFYKLSRKASYASFIWGIFAMAGFILAHNAVSLMFLPVILLYIVYLALQTNEKKQFLFNSFFVLFFGFALSAFFWLPAVMEGKYTLRDIVIRGSVQNNFVSFEQLLYGEWNYGISKVFTVQIGLLQWLGVSLSIPLVMSLYRKKKKEWIAVLTIVILFFLSLFLMTESSKIIWDKVTILQKFQFPWRILSLSMFFAAILGAFAFSVIPKKVEKIFFVIFIMFILVLTKDMWQAKGYFYKPEAFYSGIYNGTTDTGESAPIWSMRFMESQAKSQVEIIGGKATVYKGIKTTTKHQYKVVAATEAQIRENTLYFPGWKILVDKTTIPIEFQDPHNRGVITFRVPQGEHTVSVQFEETRVRFFSNALSLVGLFTLTILGILKNKLWRN